MAERMEPWIQVVSLAETTPLHRYWNANRRKDHFYTNRAEEIGTGTPALGYKHEGIVGHLLKSPTDGTKPLHRYWQPWRLNHFYTTNGEEIGTVTPALGYRYEGIVGYVLESPTLAPHGVAKPLHRYFNAWLYDHFYTTNGEEIGTGTPALGYTYEGIIGYVLTESQSVSLMLSCDLL